MEGKKVVGRGDAAKQPKYLADGVVFETVRVGTCKIAQEPKTAHFLVAFVK